ncbi:MAG: nucleotidyl transferase AbiEii/AbiGii toxin family protein [Candidatus Dormibacteria bacterium]
MPIIEKDFWVVWTLHVLFALPERGDFVFKGGTSLSKAFGLIERFSEDIDLVIDRERFGFAGSNDIAQATSGEERRRRRERLDTMVEAYLSDDLVPRLTRIVRDSCGATVEIDRADPLSILVHYPAVVPDHPYVRPVVKIETGGRADNWPTVDRSIRADVALEFPQAFENDEVIVKTIEARRTFLEKLTILHKTAHALDADEAMVIAERFSRHYYDVYRMSVQGAVDTALLDSDLLEAVRIAAQVFFPQTKAKYEEFHAGSIRIVPPISRGRGSRS